MSLRGLCIAFDALSIAAVLDKYNLIVPPNQRAYAWKVEHVRPLLQDLTAAVVGEHSPYFLDPIVSTQGKDGGLVVADGQHRLAAISMLIAAGRDHFSEGANNKKETVSLLTKDFLIQWSRRERDEHVPKLQLNLHDDDYFTRSVLTSPDPRAAAQPLDPQHSFHPRRKRAAELAAGHMRNAAAPLDQRKGYKELTRWIGFPEKSAVVTMIDALGQINACTMFEILNDGRLKAPPAEILKDFLFSEAAERVGKAQPRWAANGPRSEREFADSNKKNVSGRKQIVTLVEKLEQGAADCVALFIRLERQGRVPRGVNGHAYACMTTNVLGREQIRPLLLAVIKHFEPEEAVKALRMFLSWSARFLIAEGGGGVLKKQCVSRDGRILSRAISKARALTQLMNGVIRADSRVQEAFKTHHATNVRPLECCIADQAGPEIAYIDDPELRFNIEYVLLRTPSPQWPVKPELAQAFCERGGNLVWLSLRNNIGNQNCQIKKRSHAGRVCQLIRKITRFEDWRPKQIEGRQAKLAELALRHGCEGCT